MKEPDGRYAAIHNSVLTDSSLSLPAFRVLLYLASKPNGWVAQTGDIMKACNLTQRAVREIAKPELVKAGYARVNMLRDVTGRVARWEMVLIRENVIYAGHDQSRGKHDSGEISAELDSMLDTPDEGVSAGRDQSRGYPDSGKPRHLVTTERTPTTEVTTEVVGAKEVTTDNGPWDEAEMDQDHFGLSSNYNVVTTEEVTTESLTPVKANKELQDRSVVASHPSPECGCQSCRAHARHREEIPGSDDQAAQERLSAYGDNCSICLARGMEAVHHPQPAPQPTNLAKVSNDRDPWAKLDAGVPLESPQDAQEAPEAEEASDTRPSSLTTVEADSARCDACLGWGCDECRKVAV